MEVVNNKTGYEHSIDKDRDKASRFYKLDLVKLRKYFGLDKLVFIEDDTV